VTYDDTFLRDILRRTKTVAMVGMSANPVRPSYFVARFLQLKGMRVIGVNPGLAGQSLFGAWGPAPTPPTYFHSEEGRADFSVMPDVP